MQFEGYSGEICGDSNYERQVDVSFPSFDNTFWNVRCDVSVRRSVFP